MILSQFKTFVELKSLHNRTVAAFDADREIYGAEEIYCLGTGPSLHVTDLSLLSGKTIIYLNNAYSLIAETSPRQPIYVVSDYLRFREIRSPLLRSMPGPIYCSTDRIAQSSFPTHLYGPPCRFFMPRHCWVNDQNGVGLKIVHVGFSDSLECGLFLGFSVVFSAIQLAFHLGAKRIVLVGIDMDYASPGGAYFQSSIKDNWPVFDYKQHARDHFTIVKSALETRGVALINSTVKGAIDVVPRLDLRDVVGKVS